MLTGSNLWEINFSEAFCHVSYSCHVAGLDWELVLLLW